MDMKESYKILTDRLRDGHVEILEEVFPPEVIDVREKDLSFVDPVQVSGKAYLADGELILHLSATTYCYIPCSICNEPVKVEVGFTDFYHAQSLSEIKTGAYDYQDLVRETLLLDTPTFSECQDGKCPQRKAFNKYLKQEDVADEDGHRPFADLEKELKKK